MVSYVRVLDRFDISAEWGLSIMVPIFEGIVTSLTAVATVMKLFYHGLKVVKGCWKKVKSCFVGPAKAFVRVPKKCRNGQ